MPTTAASATPITRFMEVVPVDVDAEDSRAVVLVLFGARGVTAQPHARLPAESKQRQTARRW